MKMYTQKEVLQYGNRIDGTWPCLTDDVVSMEWWIKRTNRRRESYCRMM